MKDDDLDEIDTSTSPSLQTVAKNKMSCLAIDFKAAQLFFNLVKQSRGVIGCQ